MGGQFPCVSLLVISRTDFPPFSSQQTEIFEYELKNSFPGFHFVLHFGFVCLFVFNGETGSYSISFLFEVTEQEMIFCCPGVYYLPLPFFTMGMDPRDMSNNMSYETSLLICGLPCLAHILPLEGQRPVASGGIGWGMICNNICASAVGSLLSSPKSVSLSIHGINEKISVQAYETQVKFIFEFIQNADADLKPVPHKEEL